MCLVLAAIRIVPGHPLVLLANRDEHYDRPAEAPRNRGGDPEIVCGLDHRAGGTWLGVNGAGVVATLTNRPGEQDPARPSRGGVTMAALGARTAWDGARRAADAAAVGPNPFSLLVADREQAWFVAHDGGRADPRVIEVPAGLHTHTNLHDLDGLPATVVLAAEGFSPDAITRAGSADAALAILRRLAPSHSPLDGTRAASCVHAGYRGTVSSSLVTLADRGPSTFVYADGAPCAATYVDVLRG